MYTSEMTRELSVDCPLMFSSPSSVWEYERLIAFPSAVAAHFCLSAVHSEINQCM